MVEQDGLWYHVNQIQYDQFNSNRSDVIDLWCVASTVLSRQLGTTEFIHAPI